MGIDVAMFYVDTNRNKKGGVNNSFPFLGRPCTFGYLRYEALVSMAPVGFTVW